VAFVQLCFGHLLARGRGDVDDGVVLGLPNELVKGVIWPG
jgi:hypothetical protein